MDLARPATTLLSLIDSSVLAVLHRSERPLAVREVHRLSHTGSYEGVRSSLRRLARSGLLDVDARTAATFYALNRQHLAYAAVEALLTMRQRLIELIADAIQAWSHPPLHASLFGSFSRQDGDVESDIDVLVVFEDVAYEASPTWEGPVSDLEATVRRWTGNQATVMALGMSDVQAMAEGRRSASLWRSLLNESVAVFGTSLRSLRRATAS